MAVRQFGSLPPAGSTFDKAFLDQIRLVYILDGACILSYAYCYGVKTYRPASIMIYHRLKYVPVNRIKSHLVDLEDIKCLVSNFSRDISVKPYLRKVSDSL